MFLSANLYFNYQKYKLLFTHPTAHFQLGDSFLQNVQLLKWIKTNPNITADSVFSGNMADMAMVYVGTDFAVTNHPQFETALSRKRNTEAYQMYGRMYPKEMYDLMVARGVTHIVVNQHECLRSNQR